MTPADRAGVDAIQGIAITPDEKSFVYPIVDDFRINNEFFDGELPDVAVKVEDLPLCLYHRLTRLHRPVR
jgi:hypothetical protein